MSPGVRIRTCINYLNMHSISSGVSSGICIEGICIQVSTFTDAAVSGMQCGWHGFLDSFLETEELLRWVKTEQRPVSLLCALCTSCYIRQQFAWIIDVAEIVWQSRTQVFSQEISHLSGQIKYWRVLDPRGRVQATWAHFTHLSCSMFCLLQLLQTLSWTCHRGASQCFL